MNFRLSISIAISFILMYGAALARSNHDSYYADVLLPGQSAFNFVKPLPSRILVNDKIDLSFFVNQSVVYQYRLKIEVPAGAESSVTKSLLNWSPWVNNDINNLIIPKAGREGKYKLVVEYKTHNSAEIKKFEKLFEVYLPKSAGNSQILASSKNSTKQVYSKNLENVAENPGQIVEDIKPDITTTKVSESNMEKGEVVGDTIILSDETEYEKPILSDNQINVKPQNSDEHKVEPEKPEVNERENFNLPSAGQDMRGNKPKSNAELSGRSMGKNRALKKGFGINLITGIPVNPYGFYSESSGDYGLLFGLQIGSRWYFRPGENFGAGLMLNWFDITVSYKSLANTDEALIAADVALLEVGPIVTYRLSNDMGLDAYYNLRPTGFAVGYTYNNGSDLESYAGSGISHAFGAAFRWNILNIGMEFVLGNIKCSNTDASSFSGDSGYRFDINNIRIMLGVKF